MTPRYVIFDGSCGFCRGSVSFLAKRDRHHHFTFVSSQSEQGKRLLQPQALETLANHTIILLQGEHYYTKSEAFIKILQRLPRWGTVGAVLLWIPQGIADRVYDWIAMHRKALSLRRTCEIPNST